MSKLGAPQRTRLLTYAKCALRGLSVEASSESGKGMFSIQNQIWFVTFLFHHHCYSCLSFGRVCVLGRDRNQNSRHSAINL